MSPVRPSDQRVWKKALELDELEEGRVKSVTLDELTLCMTHWDGQYGALDNRCPHQGGPLGEGSIEKGHLRCPWHGWDYCPLTGQPPDGGYDDGVPTYPVEVREDGVYVELPAELVRDRTVSDVMVETLTNWGVRWVFGMVGHSNLNVAEAIRRQQEAGRMHYFGVRHEGAASFACSAYGKLTGRPAACLAIAGPGATNLLTGLWDAHVDRAPVLALTGQVATQVLGTGNFQELDLKAAFGQVASFAQPVLPDSPFAELASRAVKTAVLERGPAQLIFPDEVAGHASDAKAATPEGRLASQQFPPPQDALEKATTMLAAAKRPVLIVGHGARYDMPAVMSLAEALGAPVLTTFKGKGLVSDQHPLGCGVLGRSGTPIASWFMNESDLLLVLGASFSNHTGITPKKPTIQVDRDPMALAKFHAIDLPVLGDLGVTARQLLDGVRGRHASHDHAEEVASRWSIWRAEKARRREDDRGRGINSAVLFDALTRGVPADAILPVDVGNNTYSFGRYFECDRHAVLMSGYLGSIGFAFPASLGAWCATQEEGTPFHGRQVVSISGDGGFGQYPFELTTAVKYGMNLTHVLLHNGELGKISKEQRVGQWQVWETSLHNPSFAAFADDCGALGVRIERADELDAGIERALSHPGPSLVEVICDAELV
ncbi:MAG: thiamine pyrophosphate-binding protein [Myxococcota bacterium]